jgi:hypothetical protein
LTPCGTSPSPKAESRHVRRRITMAGEVRTAKKDHVCADPDHAGPHIEWGDRHTLIGHRRICSSCCPLVDERHMVAMAVGNSTVVFDAIGARKRLANHAVVDADRCWIWSGSRSGSGYGSFWVGRLAPAHRVSWVLANGCDVPAGLEIDHLCRVPLCVNPEHLEPVTPSVNVARGTSSDVRRAQAEARTTCRSGHPRTPETVRIANDGRRVCRPCGREYKTARRIAARAARIAAGEAP